MDDAPQKTYFGTFDGEGKPTGFYVTDIWPLHKIPEDALEITEGVWLELLKNPAHARYINGAVSYVTFPEPPPLPEPVTREEFDALAANVRKLVEKLT
jgi:hypothetical protein